jgi:Tol biopolymer transport system component
MRLPCAFLAGLALLASACANSDEATGQAETATDLRVSNLERTLTRVDLCPSWSPDGQMIVFPTRPRPLDPNNLLSVGGGDLTIIKADGTGELRIAAFRGGDPDWSPDGKKILYLDLGAGVVEPVKTVNPDGTDSRTIDSPATISGNPSWSPDGEQIAFSEFVSKGSGGGVEISTWISLADANGGNLRTIVGPRAEGFSRQSGLVFGRGSDRVRRWL